MNMTNSKRKMIILVTIVVILLIIAWLCRIARSGNVRGWIRCTIQCGLLIAWSVSVHKRIINPKVRYYLILIASLFAFWTVEVMVKYTILPGHPTLIRYAWYFYYIPLTIVPILALFSAMYVGKSESFVLSRKWNLLLIPAFICVCLIFTNDLHQLAFSFPGGVLNEGNDYSHEIVFYITMAIILFEYFAFLGVLFRKCRLANRDRRVVLPIIPLLLLIIYGIIYIIDYNLIAVVAGDMKSVNVYAIIFTLEFCIYKNLFPSNTHYKELFLASTISAQITDNEYNTFLSSQTSSGFSRETMEQTRKTPVTLDGNTRLSSKSIKNGYVLWAEDISELTGVISELEEINEDLDGKHTVLQEEYKTSHRRQSLVEKNRLYNQMQNQTKDKIIKLSDLIIRLKSTDDINEIKHISEEMAIITAYLKRRNNLIFIAEENGTIPVSELEYCLRESLNNIRLIGSNCDMKIHIDISLHFKAVTALYDAFETVVELTMHTIKDLFVSVSLQKELPSICLIVVCDTDLTLLNEEGFVVTREDENEWTVEYSYAEGGDDVLK